MRLSLKMIGKAALPLALCFAPLQLQAKEATTAVLFATDGHLKMLYDNRMHPAAIEYEGKIYIAWTSLGRPDGQTCRRKNHLVTQRRHGCRQRCPGHYRTRTDHQRIHGDSKVQII